MNSKGSILITILVVLAIVIVLPIMIVSGTYNSLVTKDANVENSWANIQTAYERRIDLIPNLVETIKGYTKFEEETQTEIARLRSGITKAKNPTELNKVGAEMNSLLSGIIINVEAYPDLKASEHFLSLQDELAGTENRIKWERDIFNEKVKEYKISVRRFPSNMVARMFGFDEDRYEMFQARNDAENSVDVNFD